MVLLRRFADKVAYFFLSCICLLYGKGHVLIQPSPAGGDIDMGLI